MVNKENRKYLVLWLLH